MKGNSPLRVSVAGVGLLGPGFESWVAGLGILAGELPWENGPLPSPTPAMLPPAERRRCPHPVRLALAVASEALEESGFAASEVATVFAASDDDGQLTHATYAALAQTPPVVSPTRFQNSVHNAAAGYWSIATGSRRPSTSISAYDYTFAAALLDAATQACVEQTPVLAVASDLPYPPPLWSLRPMDMGLAVSLLLCPGERPGSIAGLEISLADPVASRDDLDTAPRRINPGDITPEPLRRTPAARALPLLAAMASGRAGVVEIGYLDGGILRVSVR